MARRQKILKQMRTSPHKKCNEFLNELRRVLKTAVVFLWTLAFFTDHHVRPTLRLALFAYEYMVQGCICAPTLGFAVAHTSIKASIICLYLGSIWGKDVYVPQI